MKKLLLALGLLCTFTSSVLAQCNGVFPANTLCGSAAGGIPGQVPFSVVGGNPGGTSGQIEFNNSGSFGGFTANGDATINTATGVVTIANGAITNVKMAAGAVANSNMTAGAINTIKSTLDGTTITDNLATTIINATCLLSPTTCISMFGYANPIWYGATTASANNTPAFNAAISASTNVVVPPGTYKITASILMKPNVTFTCNPGGKITQATAVALTQFFDFNTNTAANSTVSYCTLDGNIANNTNTNSALINIVSANNVTIVWNTIINCTGSAVVSNGSIGMVAEHNVVTSCANSAFSIIGPSPGFNSKASVRFNNIFGPYFHCIQVTQADQNEINGNVCTDGGITGDFTAPLRVNVAGTAVTWVSGPTFAAAVAGTILVYNGGLEGVILTVNSTTSITLTAAGSTVSNVLAAIGSGDIYSITNASYNRVVNNFAGNGVTGCYVLSNTGGAFASTETPLTNTFDNNLGTSCGQIGIALEAFTVAGSPALNDTKITNNFIINPGRIGAAGAAGLGIQLSSVAATGTGVIVANNYLHDYSGIATNWLGGSGTAGFTNVKFGVNHSLGFSAGLGMSGYPTVASLPAVSDAGYVSLVIDANACATWGNAIAAGGAIKCIVGSNGSAYNIIGK